MTFGFFLKAEKHCVVKEHEWKESNGGVDILVHLCSPDVCLMADKSTSYILFSWAVREKESARPSQVNAFLLGIAIQSTEIQVAGCKQQELLVHVLHALITPLMDISAHSLITHTDTLMHGLPSSICMRLCLSLGPKALLEILVKDC